MKHIIEDFEDFLKVNELLEPTLKYYAVRGDTVTAVSIMCEVELVYKGKLDEAKRSLLEAYGFKRR